jgi:hypothetical protein
VLIDVPDSSGVGINLALKILNFYKLVIDLKTILAYFPGEVINLIL